MGNKYIRLGELFCGPGGIGSAASEASIETPEGRVSFVHAWATDYHEDSMRTYKANILKVDPDSEDPRAIQEDIRELNFDRLKAVSEIDGLAFGFPCNDFSLVGEQKGVNGNFGPLYTYGSKAIRLFRPQWFLAENVSGLRSSNEGNAFARILEDFADCGYTLYPHLYKFEEYGVPQARHRIIIIGIRNDLKVEFRVPAPTGVRRTAREALRSIPSSAKNQELTKQSPRVVERLKHIRPGENAFNSQIPQHLQLNVAGAKISQIYRRLDPDKPAYTVTGSGGGGTHIYHWDEPRALTNRERARLQTFPDHHEFYGSKESVRRQIGMAVPVAGVRIILEAVLKSFSHIEYPSVDPKFGVLRGAGSNIESKLEEIERLASRAKELAEELV